MARHITNNRDRATRKYKAKHAELREQLLSIQIGKMPDKIERHQASSEEYRQNG